MESCQFSSSFNKAKMSDELSVARQRKMFARIKLVEENGGNTFATREYWPLSNHSGGDGRFPTCGAKHSVLKKYSAKDAERILEADGDRNKVKTSTPKVFRARLRRPSSWASSDDVFSPPSTETSSNLRDSGLSVSPTARADTGIRRNVVGLARVIDLGAIGDNINVGANRVPGASGDNVNAEANRVPSEDYAPEDIWDSDAEEARVRDEALCVKCSR